MPTKELIDDCNRSPYFAFPQKQVHDSIITEEICTCVRFLKLKGVDKTIHIREEFLLVVWTEITRRSALSETV